MSNGERYWLGLLVGVSVGIVAGHFLDKATIKADTSLREAITEAKRIIPPVEARYHCLNIARTELGSDSVGGKSVPWYILAGINQCDERTPEMTLTVKFYNSKGERIGTDSVKVAELSPNEIFAHKWAVPKEIQSQPSKPVSVKAAHE